ncbi:MAG: SDR family NAD(P)-dependent oxidoreductase [Candidatus Binatia bacterium]
MKRAFDIVVSGAVLVVLAPLMAWIAFRVRRHDGGPALFRQPRVGRDGALFEVLKFRTMRAVSGPAITVAGDVRITHFGRLLRRWKLDELPQLWNVLRGDMSLVGPRPELPEFVRSYPEEAREILRLRPGITGPAQLEGIDEETELLAASDPESYYRSVLLPRKLAIDLRYVRAASFERDLTILARTITRLLVHGSRQGPPRWLVALIGGRRPLIQAANVLLSIASYLIAFVIRADFSLPASWIPGILRTLPVLVAARLFAFRYYGLFHGWWNYTGVNDLVDIVKAVSLSTSLFATAVVLLFGAYAVPRSVVLIDWTLLIAFLAGSRLASRLVWTWGSRALRDKTDRALIVGDVRSIEPLVRDLVESTEIPLHPVGLIGLGDSRRGFRLHNVPVLGGEEDLPTVLASTPIDVVLLALSRRDGAALRRILARASVSAASFKLVPPLRDRIDQRWLGNLRDVEVDDLLGRDEVRLDFEGIRETLAGHTVLITGAAGSIGSELARQIASRGPRTILLVDRSEHALAALEEELRGGPAQVLPLLLDIRNGERMRAVFAEHRPELVFHAAAYKHVPMMELNPIEAVKNNVFGTRDLLEVSDQFGTRKFVLISTDKAVNPINIMGSTKRIAEQLLEGSTNGGCQKIAVRFGNVFGSEGSLVPILLRQIREGGPVTITHPEATRYFMTIPEAVQLVLQASVLGNGGEIFVLDMGEPVKILDLAMSLIRLAGLTPGRDIEIRITGLRPGERLHEEALIDAAVVPTVHHKIWMRRSTRLPKALDEELPVIEELVRNYDQRGVLAWLRQWSEAGTAQEASP